MATNRRVMGTIGHEDDVPYGIGSDDFHPTFWAARYRWRYQHCFWEGEITEDTDSLCGRVSCEGIEGDTWEDTYNEREGGECYSPRCPICEKQEGIELERMRVEAKEYRKVMRKERKRWLAGRGG